MLEKKTDVKVVAVSLYFMPVETRIPLKFGPETLTSVTCARVSMSVADRGNNIATGWGETPLSVQWVWPGNLSYRERHEALKDFTIALSEAWSGFNVAGHPLEVGYEFQRTELKRLLEDFNASRNDSEDMPWLAALVCCSAFDIALHDAYGVVHNIPTYETYNAKYMNSDLARFLTTADDMDITFEGKYPSDFLVSSPDTRMMAWHLVGGKDLIDSSELTGSEPDDGYPVLLRDWIHRDGLKCLKVKLRGNDNEWDYDRLVKVGKIAEEEGVYWLTTDFNCTVTDPAYVNDILDRFMLEYPRLYAMILYVEQPFPYDLEHNQIDVHSVSARKPLFMDESCHDWQLIKLGRKLGWTGVALKTCKTQTGAILSACWAKMHGMTLMVQDLTNPMLAQIPHCLLAYHVGTIMGVETNSMQFYPDASLCEMAVHPGLYRRRDGVVDISTIKGGGLGYCVDKIDRPLPEPASAYSEK